MVQFTTAQKGQLYEDAVITALAETALVIGGPDINAAIAALTMAQGYLISAIADRNARRLAEKATIEGLGNHIAAFVNQRIIDAQDKATPAGQDGQ